MTKAEVGLKLILETSLVFDVSVKVGVCEPDQDRYNREGWTPLPPPMRSVSIEVVKEVKERRSDGCSILP